MGFKKEKAIQLTPGPADYYNESKKYKGHYLGSAPRPLNLSAEKTPGPGAYYQLSTIGNVPEYSYSRRHDNKFR